MKNKKSLIAIIAILLVAVVGGTFAYFQTTGVFENLFPTGVYRLVTTEVFESPDNWKPGETIPKTITTTNEGTIPAAVRVSYTEQWLDGDNDITSSIDEDSAIINFDNTDDWIEEDGYYYYKYILNPGKTTSSFIKSVTLNEELGEVHCTEEGLTHVCEAANPALGATYKLTITKETIQADKYSEWNSSVELTEKTDSVVTILSGTKGNLQPGDMVGIGETEDFYVISSDNSTNGKTLLFAEYNLLVGNIVENNQIVGQISSDTPGYGLQSVDAVAGYNTSNSYGSIQFANNNYWISNNNNLANDYSENGQIYYDNNASDSYETFFKYTSDNSYAYPYVYDENSSIYQYISGPNGYVNKLIEIGAPSTIRGRLLTYEEANNLINVMNKDGDSLIFNMNGDYWLGSIHKPNDIYAVTEFYSFLYGFSYNAYTDTFGVRPVIEIYTEDIN